MNLHEILTTFDEFSQICNKGYATKSTLQPEVYDFD